jgi:hypothetical protein
MHEMLATPFTGRSGRDRVLQRPEARRRGGGSVQTGIALSGRLTRVLASLMQVDGKAGYAARGGSDGYVIGACAR